MLMPGRKYAASPASSYRYSINGQEKEAELNDNITTALYWEYDSRIGRRWNVDPKPNVSISLYNCFNGNPILFPDYLGDKADSTGYYSNDGTLLLQTTGKGYNHAVVVNDDKVNCIKALAENKTVKANANNDAFQNALDKVIAKRDVGTTYDIGSFEKFYNENQIPAAKLGNDNIKDMSNFLYNKKPLKLKAEVYGDVVLNNGILTVGKGKTTTGSANMGFFDDIPRVSNSVADIHNHPIAETGTFTYTLKIPGGSITRSGSMVAGPSLADMGHAQFNSNNYRSIVVDSKNVYLYGSPGTPLIKIARK